MDRLLRGLEKHIVFVMSAAVGGGVIAVYTPHSFALKYVKNAFVACKDGVEVPVDPYTKELAQTVFDKINLDPIYEAHTVLFTINGQELYDKGACQMRTGAIIGIPPTYACKTLEEIYQSKIEVGGKRIDENSPAGQSLCKSLLLSDQAKRFGIARGIQHTNDHHVYVKSVLFAGLATAAYWSGRIVGNITNIKQSPRLFHRFTLYGAVSFGYLVLFGLFNDVYECRRDRRSDRWAAELGKDYALGGIEYYNKALQRNMAIRAILGKEGQKIYTAYGNHVPRTLEIAVTLTERRENLLKHFEKYVEQELKDKEAKEEVS